MRLRSHCGVLGSFQIAGKIRGQREDVLPLRIVDHETIRAMSAHRASAQWSERDFPGLRRLSPFCTGGPQAARLVAIAAIAVIR